MEEAIKCKTILLTTGHQPCSAYAEHALFLMQQLSSHSIQAIFVEREGQTLAKMLEEHEADMVLVVSARGTMLRLRGGAEHCLHGGIGVLRLRAADAGRPDNLVRVCGLQPGDVFIDATAGHLCDSIVAAQAVGLSGRVLAMEASPLLWAVAAGRPVATGDARVDKLLDRVDMLLGDHTELLTAMPAASADVVYFDPMFRRPAKSSKSFDFIRPLALHSPLTAAALAQARRVARRRVVVMDQRGGSELERLGLRVLKESAQKRYGVIDILQTCEADHSHTQLDLCDSTGEVDS
mmetsp:Transcript_4630/g.7835  ORF Transcript_4630/g.7835 Transcript_4630/m.7835 type:complete len:293 (-) Transcript_4630:47-925(-)